MIIANNTLKNLDISGLLRTFASHQQLITIIMEFEITEIEALTGPKAHIYSVIMEGEDKSLLEQFFDENVAYVKDLKKVINKIHIIAHDTGCRRSFFKEGEGAWGDGMVALDFTGRLRLYGIYFHDAVILFGSGGYKPSNVKAYEDHPPLNEKAQQMKVIAKEIYRRITDGELKVNSDGTLDE